MLTNNSEKTLKEFNAKIDFPVNIELAAPGACVLRSERNNSFIKERIRARGHQLLFIHLPKILLRHIVMEETR